MAYGKKALNQAMGSSFQKGGLSQRSSLGDNLESRDDNGGEGEGGVEEDESRGCDENWGHDGNVTRLEDWPDYDNVRTVPIGQGRKGRYAGIDATDERDDVEGGEESSEENHSTYFHSMSNIIDDLAGGDMNAAFMDDTDGQYEAEVDKYGSYASFASGKKDHHSLFKSKKGRKFFGRAKSASSSSLIR